MHLRETPSTPEPDDAPPLLAGAAMLWAVGLVTLAALIVLVLAPTPPWP